MKCSNKYIKLSLLERRDVTAQCKASEQKAALLSICNSEPVCKPISWLHPGAQRDTGTVATGATTSSRKTWKPENASHVILLKECLGEGTQRRVAPKVAPQAPLAQPPLAAPPFPYLWCRDEQDKPLCGGLWRAADKSVEYTQGWLKTAAPFAMHTV